MSRTARSRDDRLPADQVTRRLAAASATHSGGDPNQVRRRIEAELRRQPANGTLRMMLARLKAATGDRAGAAIELSRVLAREPGNVAAARRLGALLAHGRLPAGIRLDAAGLAASLRHTSVDRDLIAAASVYELLQREPLSSLVSRAREVGSEEVARAVLARRSAPLLRDDLLIAVLEHANVTSPDVERLLTALRRIMSLELAPERLLEPDLGRFAVALARQCWSNEHVFAESDAEIAWLESPPPAAERLLAGDALAGVACLRRALYRDPVTFLPAGLSAADHGAIVPAGFGEALREFRAERLELARKAGSLTVSCRINDETSLKIKSQYESHPYPRWRGVAVDPDAGFLAHIGTFFSRGDLAFAAAPFDLLVAGCGTGCQAVSAALDWGPNARVLGIDLSAASLGYAALMAERMQVANLSLAVDDIAHLDAHGPAWRGRFRVIECTGVLHHMAEPFHAWRRLLDCLHPDGLMLIGLYSRLARRELDDLCRDPGYPGPGCSDAALRRYRAELFARPPGAPGTRYLRSRDAFTTSGFRDFFLNVHERRMTLGEIAGFLAAEGLAFRGFANVPFARLARRFPDERFPGRLERWAELEAEEPDLFLGMYQLWLQRA